MRRLSKNIVLLGETDEKHGKPSIDELIAKCPEDLKHIFNDNVIIPYFSDPDFMAVTFDKMNRVLAEESHTIQDTTSSRNKGHELRFSQHEMEAESVVMHPSFTIFAALVGMGLPGSKRRTRRWAKIAKPILLVSMVLCALRFFLPEGPSFLDHLAVAQLMATHGFVLFMGCSLQALLRNPILDDLLENHINCPKQVSRFRRRTKILTAISATLTVVLSIWGWFAYLPGFFSSYYLDSGSHSGAEHVPVFGVIGMIHGVVWFLSLPLVFGWFFTSLIIMFVLQEMCFMALATAYAELHPEIGIAGLEAVAATPAAMNVKEIDIFHFEEKYMASWELYRKIQWKTAAPQYVFWTLQVALLVWSIWSLSQGFEPLPAGDDRALRFQSHWNLVVRLAWLLGGSPWFGVGCWLMGLMPFTAILYARRMRMQTRQLFFTLADLRAPFQNFLADLELEYRVLLLQATPLLSLAFVSVLFANTLGFLADATRLFRSL